MGSFSDDEKKLFVGTLVFNITFDTICLIIAFHNVIRYVCKPRNQKSLINIFYSLIVIALISKICHDAYLL